MKLSSTFYSQKSKSGCLTTLEEFSLLNSCCWLFHDAYLRAASALTAANGFRQTGIMAYKSRRVQRSTRCSWCASEVTVKWQHRVLRLLSSDTCTVQPDESLASTSHTTHTGKFLKNTTFELQNGVKFRIDGSGLVTPY